jgi:hypothetical protein
MIKTTLNYDILRYLFRVNQINMKGGLANSAPQTPLPRSGVCSYISLCGLGKIIQKRLVIKALKFNFDEVVLKEIKHSMIFLNNKFNRASWQRILPTLVTHTFYHQG